MKTTSSPFKGLSKPSLAFLTIVVLLAIGYISSFVFFKNNGENYIIREHIEALSVQKLPYTIELDQLNERIPEKIYGWAYSEEWGSWTLGGKTILAFKLEDHYRGQEVEIEIDLVHQHIQKDKPLIVEPTINGNNFEAWVFNEGSSQTKLLQTQVPENEAMVSITFDITNFSSPADNWAGGDRRPLGIGIRQITCRSIKD